MRYCAACLTEHADDAQRCSDCGAELVSRGTFEELTAERDEVLTEPYEKVCILDDRFEGPLLEQVLEAAGIRSLVRSYQDSAYDGIFIPQKGWGALFVPKRDAERARELVEAERQAVGKPTGDAAD